MTKPRVHCAALVLLLGGCAAGQERSALLPAPAPNGHAERALVKQKTPRGYVYVANRTQQGGSQLLVYEAGVADPSPIRTITQGLSEIAGVAVDSDGNAYVANAGDGDVLEFSPGATSLVRTYSRGLARPVAVAVANGTLFVSDQGNARNGYMQQVLEYPVGSGIPSAYIGGLGAPGQLNAAIAVNSIASDAAFFVSASSLAATPPHGPCSSGNAFTVGANIFPTLWDLIPLAHNTQASGLAFDASGNLYVADPCASAIDVYSKVRYEWTYVRSMPGSFSVPYFITISKQFLAVPSSAQSLSRGYVTVIDLTGDSSTITIARKMRHPVGAAVGWSS